MLCPEELLALSTAIAAALAKGKSQEEINLMAGLLGHVSSSLAVISIQRSRIDACCGRTASPNQTVTETII